jgi:hypothetical protein
MQQLQQCARSRCRLEGLCNAGWRLCDRRTYVEMKALDASDRPPDRGLRGPPVPGCPKALKAALAADRRSPASTVSETRDVPAGWSVSLSVTQAAAAGVVGGLLGAWLAVLLVVMVGIRNPEGAALVGAVMAATGCTLGAMLGTILASE